MSKVGRKQKRSAAGASAYRSGERLVDPRSGAEYDYSRRRGVASTHLIVPGAPVDAIDRQHLWGSIEEHHRRGDAVTAREVVVSIPWDLDPLDRQELVLRYARELSERYSTAVDVAIHLPSIRPGRDPRNHHAHLLLTACSAELRGGELVLGRKVEALDPISRQRAGLDPVCDAERARWAELCRSARSAAGLPEQPIDHRSYERQGRDEIRQIHLGPAAKDNLERHLAGQNVVLLAKTRQWLEREEARAALAEAKRLESEIEAEEAAELTGAIEPEPEPAPAPRPRRIEPEPEERRPAERETRESGPRLGTPREWRAIWPPAPRAGRWQREAADVLAELARWRQAAERLHKLGDRLQLAAEDGVAGEQLRRLLASLVQGVRELCVRVGSLIDRLRGLPAEQKEARGPRTAARSKPGEATPEQQDQVHDRPRTLFEKLQAEAAARSKLGEATPEQQDQVHDRPRTLFEKLQAEAAARSIDNDREDDDWPAPV